MFTTPRGGLFEHVVDPIDGDAPRGRPVVLRCRAMIEGRLLPLFASERVPDGVEAAVAGVARALRG